MNVHWILIFHFNLTTTACGCISVLRFPTCLLKENICLHKGNSKVGALDVKNKGQYNGKNVILNTWKFKCKTNFVSGKNEKCLLSTLYGIKKIIVFYPALIFVTIICLHNFFELLIKRQWWCSKVDTIEHSN